MLDVGHSVFVQSQQYGDDVQPYLTQCGYPAHAHLVKLGHDGRYGTPRCGDSRGFFEIEFAGAGAAAFSAAGKLVVSLVEGARFQQRHVRLQDWGFAARKMQEWCWHAHRGTETRPTLLTRVI